MVTGDNKVTAYAIAKEIGLISEKKENLVMEGPEFMREIGGVICSVCKTEECDCPKDRNELELPENKGKKIRIDTI